MNQYNLKEKKSIKEKLSGAKYALAGCILLPLVLLIVSAVSTSAKGVELGGIEEQISEINKENKEIKEQIVKSSSLTKLRDDISSADYVEPETVIYLNNEHTEVAQLP